MQIDPDVVIVKAKGGREIRRHIALANKSDAVLKLTVQPEYWVQPPGLPGLAEWLDIKPGVVEIPAHGRQQVNVRFKLPEVLQGESLVMIYFAGDATGANIKILPRIGMPLYVCRQGTEIIKAAVEGFTAVPGKAAQGFELKIRNDGNVHVIPFGNVQVKDQSGKLLYLKEFRYSEPVFSGQSGKVEIVGSPLPRGSYSAKAEIYLDSLYAAPVGARQRLSMQCQFFYP